MSQITLATGNTYPAKAALKAAGFEWIVNQWVFKGVYDVEKWNNTYANPTWYGRGNAKNCAGVKFEVRNSVL